MATSLHANKVRVSFTMAQSTTTDDDTVIIKEEEENVESANGAMTQSHMKASEKKKTKKKKSLNINLTHCRYDSVRRVAKRCGLQPVVGENSDWTVYWVDTSIMMERVMDMKRYQKINHFPGMGEICRKDLLSRNLTRMKKLFPKEYNIFPHTWVMPADYSDFQAFCRLKKHKTFISKPETGCQGKGISIFKNPKFIKPGEHCVVQQYISKPFIIDGFKFDYRIYVLVTSCDPLYIYVYKDGLGRFATIQYREPTRHNLDESCLHLTNYSINKNSEDFIRDDISGSKRRLTTVDQWFINNGYDIKKIWTGIEDVIIKTLISAHTVLRHNYRSCFPSHTHGSACFEILGFDVLLDHKLKAWIIEVNHSPSFHTDSPLDKEVKESLLYDTLQLIDLRATDKKKCMEEDKKRVQQRLLTRHKTKDTCNKDEDIKAKYTAHQQAYEKKYIGGFRRIYPLQFEEETSSDPYLKYFEQSTSLCTETAASKARIELARLQRQEIEHKAKEEEVLRNKLSCGANRLTGPEQKRVIKDNMIGCESQNEGNGRRTMLTRRIPFRLKTEQTLKQLPITTQDTEQAAHITPVATPLPYEIIPQDIIEDEELERLAGLQIRERLIRGLDIPNIISLMLSSPQSPPPLHTSLLAPHPPSPPHTIIRRHTQSSSSTHQYKSQLSMSAGRHRLPAAHNKSSQFLTLRNGQPSSSRQPLETFGLLVTAAPVTNRIRSLS